MKSLKWINECELNNRSDWIGKVHEIISSINATFIVMGHLKEHWDFGDKLGVMMPKLLNDYYYAPPEVERVFKHFDPAYGISIREDVREGTEEYLAYILGHEIGHALICEKEGIETHVLCCLVYSYIQKASSNFINPAIQLPSENYCDLYGKALASAVFSESSVNQCFETLIQNKQGDTRLEWLIEQPSIFPTFSVNEAMRELILPYRSKLVELWVSDRGGRDPLDPLVRWPKDISTFI